MIVGCYIYTDGILSFEPKLLCVIVVTTLMTTTVLLVRNVMMMMITVTMRTPPRNRKDNGSGECGDADVAQTESVHNHGRPDRHQCGLFADTLGLLWDRFGGTITSGILWVRVALSNFGITSGLL